MLQYYTNYCTNMAYSKVVWCLRNPAWMGAWSSLCSAKVVSLRFMTAMNSLLKGGVIAMLR